MYGILSKYIIELSKNARNDLLDIAKYIKYNLEEPNIARKIIKKIENSIYKLEDNPYICSIINDKYLREKELRKLIVGNYIVFYRIIDNTFKIQIVRVLYGRRNWQDILK